ncbi:MAG: hypothetical protein AAGA55_02360 [Planctomycetota bacterium]
MPSTEYAADLAVPFGELDFSDVSAFLTAYQASEPPADIEQLSGVCSFFDLSKLLTVYNTGRP